MSLSDQMRKVVSDSVDAKRDAIREEIQKAAERGEHICWIDISTSYKVREWLTGEGFTLVELVDSWQVSWY